MSSATLLLGTSPDSAMHLHPLRQILSQRSVHPHFQPIVSIKRKALIGVESLARAVDPCSGAPVSPLQLFAWAREQGRLLELDRCCQSRAFEAFSTLPSRDPELLLFLNVEAALLDRGQDLDLGAAARRAGVDPCTVVLEINESAVQDPRQLPAFVERHRAQGFLIAMDDLGSGASSLQRWPVLKPDVIKLDRSLVDGIARSFYARELVRSLITLGRQTGALILAEGVEQEADVDACLDLGVDLFQGYYFARPAPEPYENLDPALDKAVACAARHKERGLERLAGRHQAMERRREQARLLADSLAGVEPRDFRRVLLGLPWPAEVESVFLLDREGQQASPVLFLGERVHGDRVALFQPSRPGSDHSDRDYHYALLEGGLGRDTFLSEPHLSTASGRLSRTLSHRFEHGSHGTFVICLEIGAD